MRFLVISTGRNCADRVDACLESIAIQCGHSVHVAIVDDCSDDGTDQVVRGFLERGGMPHDASFLRTPERRGAMLNQFESWTDPEVGYDVALWCDLDDRLNGPDVLNRLAVEYETGALMTYGSYEPAPSSPTCAPARPFPAAVARDGSHRAFMQAKGGLLANHLRSVHRSVLEQIGPEDCQDDDGQWFMVAPDLAVMTCALELARERCHFIEDTLLLYSSDRMDAEFRVANAEVRRVHQLIIHRPPKLPVSAAAVRVARFEAVQARRQRQRETVKR